MIQAETSAHRNQAERPARWRVAVGGLFALLAAALALAPLVNIVTIIATTGADNLSNDYLAYTGMVGKVLSGTYDWSGYLRDTFYRTHSVALPVFLHILDARFFHWSVYPELYAGVALAALRVVMLQQMLSVGADRRMKLCLWPLLGLLVFSASQVSLFVYGDAALTIGLALFGFTLGVWGLLTRPGTAAGLLAMLAGGLTASFSWGNGLVSWMVFLVALALTGHRRWWHYALWAVGLGISILPYTLLLPVPGVSHGPQPAAGTTIVSLFNWRFIVNALGWPLSNDIASQAESLKQARDAGWTGLGLLAAGAFLLIGARSKELWRQSVPALLLVGHGFISLWQISVFRALLAPWYTAVAMSFWIGLGAAALVSLFQPRDAQGQPAGYRRLVPAAHRLWGLVVLLFMAGAYSSSNLTYQDKTDLLFSRSPASASAIRHYRTAPTYGEGLVFQWGVGNPGLLELLASPLEKHGLSVFAPRQTWTLQGDFLLDRVRIHEHPGAADIIWTAKKSAADRLPWNHFKHLNLLIPAPNAVTWTVDLPAGLRKAEFVSAVAASSPDQEPGDSGSTGGPWCEISAKPERGRDRLAVALPVKSLNGAWRPVRLDLTPLKGQRVTLKLAVRHAGNKEAATVVYRYPRIEVLETQPTHSKEPGQTRPSNTDASPEMPATTPDDMVFDLKPTDPWAVPSSGQAQPAAPIKEPHDASALEYTGQLRLHLDQYSHFWVKLAADPRIKPRVLTVNMKIAGRKDRPTFQLPLLPDGNMHAYTYDLKLLELPRSCRLTGMSLELGSGQSKDGQARSEIAQIRFLRKNPQ
ncbi:MAG TPA: hypothetical protein V6D08_20600 [Candidatus Obscuribacterales bacterium]